jgi:signal transduction histidine kinase
MWISKHLKLSQSHSELEALILERTAELQRLSQRLLKVQDEERRKLARDLHDSTGQTLAALKINVSLLQEDCKAESERTAMLSGVAQLADQAISEIRTMSYLLHDYFYLAGAIAKASGDRPLPCLAGELD